MFKKIEIWILYLTILVSVLAGLAFGVLVRQETLGRTQAGIIDIGFISKPAAFIASLPEQILISLLRPDPLRADSLLSDDKDFYSQDGFVGTTNASASYLLLSRYDGTLREGLVELVDLTTFKTLHTWNPDIDFLNGLVEKVDEFTFLDRDANDSRHLLYHPIISKKGELIFHGQTTPLRSIDACSNLVFQNIEDIFHHSIEKDLDGNIWTSSHLYPQHLPSELVGRDSPRQGGYRDDAVVQLSPDGNILYEKSISEIFIDNGLETRLQMVGGDHMFQTDPIHVNDIQPVIYDGEYWKKGDLFMSLGHQSMVILFRPSTGKILWKYETDIYHQHDVNILDEKRITIFNNNRKYLPRGNAVIGANEVLIYNFETQEVSSYMQESLARENVKTLSQGRSDILPNGDLFVEETDHARTLYFNADGTSRWTHVNQADNGNVYRVGWSRILFSEEDVQDIEGFLENRRVCDA